MNPNSSNPTPDPKQIDPMLVEKVLHFDALREAEILTGENYKESKGTEALGFAMHLEHSAAKNALLKMMDDTPLCCKLDDYLRIISEMGFEKVLEIPFINHHDGGKEQFFIYWCAERSMLLSFDTFGDILNGGNFYFNAAAKRAAEYLANPKAPLDLPKLHMSGSFLSYRKILPDNKVRWELDPRYVHVGYRDCREAVRHFLTQMDLHYTYLPKWEEQPFLWLLHYGDTKGGSGSYNYEKINAERIAMLPEQVRNAITTDAKTA